MNGKPQSNLAMNVLMLLLFLSAAATIVLAFQYNRSVRNYQGSQPKLATVNFERARIEALTRVAIEYGKRNPGLVPILTNFVNRTNILVSTNPPASR